ncbi:hypothetical protein AB0C76_01190 [Kitasatospora sp. NPDC048722]
MSALDTTGIATVGGTRLLGGPNNLEPALAPDDAARIRARLA